MEQKENFCLFFLLSLFHHCNAFGKLPASYQYPSFRTLTYMLLTKQSSCPYFSAPEFWEKEKLHLKSGGSQPSPRDAISEPGPISRHNHGAHQCGRRGRAPCVWPWLLFCGGTWRCGDWDNHTDRFCQGPRCDQQLNQVFHTFLLCLISESALDSNFLALLLFASSVSGDSFFKCAFFFFLKWRGLFILFRSEVSLRLQLPVNWFSNTHHTLSAQSWPYWC